MADTNMLDAHVKGDHDETILGWPLPGCPRCDADLAIYLITGYGPVNLPPAKPKPSRDVAGCLDAAMRAFGVFIVIFAALYFGAHIIAYLLTKGTP